MIFFFYLNKTKLNKKMSHVSILNLDLSKLQVAKSGRTIKLLYNKQPLQLITPKMFSPFGVKINNSDYSSFSNCHLDCSIDNNKTTESMLVDAAFSKFDERVIELLKENENLFKDQDVVDSSSYQSTLKQNKTFPKLLKMSFPRDKNGNFDFVLFNVDKAKIPLNDSNIDEMIPKKTVFKGIIECSKIWNFKGRFGCTWNLIQMRLAPKNNAAGDPEEASSGVSKINYSANMMLD